MNGQNDLARELAGKLRNSNQIAALTLGIILLEEGNKSIALAALKRTVGMDSGSLAADVGRRLLGENGSEILEYFFEFGNNVHQKKSQNANSRHKHDNRINHCAFDLVL